MKVSVVILNWNGCDMLRTFLPSVVRYSAGEGIEVCVADNGSTDASVTFFNRNFLLSERLYSIRIMALRMDII